MFIKKGIITLTELIVGAFIFSFLTLFIFIIFKNSSYSLSQNKVIVGLQGDAIFIQSVLKRDLYNANLSSLIIQTNYIKVNFLGKELNVSRDNLGFAIRDDIFKESFTVKYGGYIYYFTTKDNLGSMYRILSPTDANGKVLPNATYKGLLPNKAEISDFDKFPSVGADDRKSLLSSYILKSKYNLNGDTLSVYIVLAKLILNKSNSKILIKFTSKLFDF